ncbi:MAG TPA: class I SAM-dependent methyltransferase [Verrucomicrobiae bacterium]|nr:class I SAM-dependent methyltransferase [Verrucomicrobiae bacterium]
MKRLLARLKPEDSLDKALRLAQLIEGQVSPNELRILIELAKKVPASNVIVEIGTYRGRSAVALALGAQLGSGARVYAIDPHVTFKGVKGGQFGPPDMAALYANLAKAGVGETVAVVCLPSLIPAQAWRGRDVGLLWLDGDHSYEGVRADFDAWFPLVIHDGMVAFHDVDAPGVKQLLNEVARDGRVEFVGNVERLSWLRKR